MHILTTLFVCCCGLYGALLLATFSLAVLLHWNHVANVEPVWNEEDHEDVRLHQRTPKR